MPFGYDKYLEEQGYSDKTVGSYIFAINSFFHYLDSTYKQSKELYEIKPSDIKGFLEKLLEQGSNVSTVNKHLTILKGFFDYLWEQNTIPVDPTVKIKRYQKREIKPLGLNYEELLELLPKILHNDYSFLRKSIFILALKGLRVSEFQFKKDDVKEIPNGVHITLKKHTLTLDGLEAECFLRYYYESFFHDSEYVFVTNKHNGEVVPVEMDSLYNHLSAISKDYHIEPRLSFNGIRHAYVYYLYKKQKLSIEEIAKTLGIKNPSAANLLNFSIERVENQIYS